MSLRLRPGVYASYEVKDAAELSSGTSELVGIAAQAEIGEEGIIAGTAQAIEEYGESGLTELIRIAMLNGAGSVYALPVKDGDYANAVLRLCDESEVKFICCDATDKENQKAIKTALDTSPDSAKYRIIVFEGDGEAGTLSERAKSLNSENIVLIGNSSGSAGCLAAALTGLLSSRTDPALPVNGEVLKGISALVNYYGDAETEIMLEAGVTPVEMLLGEASIVRCVSTRTMTNGVADGSYRDINTVMIINYVLPRIGDMLYRDFKGKRINAYTKSAVCSAVTDELEKMLRREIIAGYGQVTVSESPDDTGACVVGFEFSAAKGLHIIELSVNVEL